jgi:hypothetical protein
LQANVGSSPANFLSKQNWFFGVFKTTAAVKFYLATVPKPAAAVQLSAPVQIAPQRQHYFKASKRNLCWRQQLKSFAAG